VTDTLSPAQRSRVMARIRGKDTAPELLVRRVTHALGYRYRVHQRGLPGCPDLVFSGRRRVIFVHGCFWHRHNCRKGRSMPSTRPQFWRSKLEANRERDRKNQRELRGRGWDVLVVWECQTTDRARLAERICDFLDAP